MNAGQLCIERLCFFFMGKFILLLKYTMYQLYCLCYYTCCRCATKYRCGRRLAFRRRRGCGCLCNGHHLWRRWLLCELRMLSCLGRCAAALTISVNAFSSAMCSLAVLLERKLVRISMLQCTKCDGHQHTPHHFELCQTTVSVALPLYLRVDLVVRPVHTSPSASFASHRSEVQV